MIRTMNVVIAGAGEVGRHAAEVLAHVGHNIVMIDRSAKTLAAVEEALDVSTLLGSACDARVLTTAGTANADLLVAATDTDEINLLCAAIGKELGAKKTMARVHHSAYQATEPLNYAQFLNIDALIPPEYLTSLEIARMLRNPGAMAVELFARGQIEMQQIFVNEGAEAVGVSLKDLRAKLPRGALLGAIDRGGPRACGSLRRDRPDEEFGGRVALFAGIPRCRYVHLRRCADGIIGGSPKSPATAIPAASAAARSPGPSRFRHCCERSRGQRSSDAQGASACHPRRGRPRAAHRRV